MPLQIRILALVTSLALAPAPGVASAQSLSSSADVTFRVPLNLTNLASEIAKVRVRCVVKGLALIGTTQRAGEIEVPVTLRQTGFQVVSTAEVVVLIPASGLDLTNSSHANYTHGNYTCQLDGYSPALGWREFNSAAGPTFNLSPSPAPLVGTFQW